MPGLKKTVTGLLVLCLLTGSALMAFAADFADMNEAPWAQTHIQRMAEKGVVSGSTDANSGQRVYRPNNPVTKVEAVVMLYSVLEKTDSLSSSTNYATKFETMLNSAKMPQWAHKQTAYALETGIIATADLTSFMSDGNGDPTQTPASREEVAIYFGRAVDDRDIVANGSGINFVDAERIGSTALPYVEQLVNLGIISGDNENRFNPTATITRAEMAALLSKTYDVLEKNIDDPIVIEIPVQNKDDDDWLTGAIRRERGKILRVNHDTGILIVKLDNFNEPEILEVTDKTVIMINSLTQELINLKADAEGEFTFDDHDRLIRININPRQARFSGYLRTITNDGSGYAIVIESTADRNDQRSFRVTTATEIVIDGRLVTPTALREGDYLTIRYEGVEAISIEDQDYTATETEVEGILDSAISFSRFPYVLSLRQLNNEVKEYEVDADATVYLDDKRGYLEELMRGDIVTLRIDQNGLVTRITATAFNETRRVEGQIVEIRLARPNQITILKDNREEETYDIAEGVVIYVDNQRSNLGELKAGTEVTLEFQGGRVIEIEADKVASGDRVITGSIVRFNDNINRLVVNHLSTQTGRYQDISVYVNNSTVIIDYDGKNITTRGLTRDDEVMIRGYYENDDFIAERIIVVDK